ncbi:MAG: chemotaxis protein CheB [Balneolales bacterium]
MARRDIVVIGASAGGVDILIELAKSLPEDFAATLFIVLHIPPYSPSRMPELLSKAGPLTAIHPKDGEVVKKGMIYIAPPDHHLLCEGDHVIISKGPKENRFRPSVDALFRSSAYTYGPRVVGVVLTGALNDGTSGLWSVKRMGGVAIVQDPDDAPFPHMPANVLEYVEPDHLVPASEIAALLTRLTSEPSPKKPKIPKNELERLEMEVLISIKDNAFEMGIMNMGELTPYTCPDCHGAFVGLKEGKTIRYRCHTGHAFTISALMAGISANINDQLWQAMRGLEESAMLLRQMGEYFEKNGLKDTAELFYKKSQRTSSQAQIVHDSAYENENISEDIRRQDMYQ